MKRCKDPPMEERRNYLRTIGALVAGLAVGGAVAYVAKPAERVVETVTETVTKTVTVTPAPTIKVCMPISLTGPLGGAGKLTSEGIRLWVEDVNAEDGIYIREYGMKRIVELIIYDDKSDIDTTVLLTKKLITEDKVDILLAPYDSDLTSAASMISEEYGVLMIAATATSPAIYQREYEYIIQLPTPDIYYMSGAVEMANKADPTIKTLALLHGDDSHSINVADGIEAKAMELGIEIVYRQEYPIGITDLTPQLLEIKALKPDLLMGGSYFNDEILIARQLKELDIKPKLVCLRAAADPEWWVVLGPDGNHFCAPVSWVAEARYTPDFGPTSEEFITRSREMWDHDPDYRSADGYAAGLVIQELIEKTGTLDSNELRDAANELEFTIFSGDFKIDPKTGLQVERKALITQWRDGEMVPVWPPDVAIEEVHFYCHGK